MSRIYFVRFVHSGLSIRGDIVRWVRNDTTLPVTLEGTIRHVSAVPLTVDDALVVADILFLSFG